MQCYTWADGRKKRKNAYPSHRAARIALRQAAEKYGINPNDYDTYRCKDCRQIHYGRKPDVTRAKVREGVPCHA